MMVIDVHHHWVPTEYLDALAAEAASPSHGLNAAALEYGANRQLTELSESLAAMDAAGVDRAVLSLPTPGVQLGDLVEFASEVNDAMVRAVRTDPSRFCALAALPFPDADAAVAELDRLAKCDEIRGVGVMTNSQAWTLDDPVFEPVYARAAELRLPIVLHPQLDALEPAFGDYGLEASFAPMVSSSLAVLRLVLSGMLDRVPDLDMVVPHLGGTVPYLAQRIMDQSGRGRADLDLVEYCRTRIWFDSCSYHQPAMRCAAETFGANRLLLGTDHPFRGPLRRGVEDILSFGFAPRLREAVLGRNAGRWFGADPRV